MALIEDIRVNGQQATATTAPTIAGLHPVFSWDFTEDEAAFAQEIYFIRVGSTAINLGTSDFGGDLIAVTNVFSSNFFEYTVHNLIRGRTYFAQVKVTDPDGDETPWASFSFKTNNLPFVTSFSIAPTAPEISENLEVSYTYTDPDGHQESGTKIRWYRNNLPVSEHDDLCILPSVATAAGESWTARITPSDGLEFGSIAETGAVTIQGTQSAFQEITILPADANVDDILKAEWVIVETEYTALTGTVNFTWFINGTVVPDSNRQFIRLNLTPGDSVSVSLDLVATGGNVLAEASSQDKVINDVDWHLFGLSINELVEAINITDLTPIVEWNKHKTTSNFGDAPSFFRLQITKTPSRSGPIHDTGVIAYTKDTFTIPSGVLTRGQNYYVHVGASDVSPVPDDNFIVAELNIVGSSWDENVSNATGWTIETKFFLVCTDINACENDLFDPLKVPPGPPDPTDPLNPPLSRVGMYIHDGTKFCTITFEQKKVIFHSDTTVSIDLPLSAPDLTDAKTFRIAGKGSDVRIFMNNKLLLNATGLLTNNSNLKFIEYGDIDGKYTSEAVFRFFRFTTLGALGIGESLPNENTFHFFEVGQLDGGTIENVQSNLVSWLPDDVNESAKLIEFNENASETQLPTVTKNFSPITSIALDKNRNKYIGTANGANAIYGEKHNADYSFITSDTDVVISTDDFDRITSVATDQIALVEPDSKAGWFTIDTTFRTIGVTDPLAGFATGDPYDPYKFGIDSHAIHYYSQRTHGHKWYDMADNERGWQITFSFELEVLEQDDFQEQNIDHKGFGVYINDGTFQEVLYFYHDRIRLFYANVFIPIVTTSARNYRIVGRGKNIFIYQKLDIASITSYQLLINGTGMFTTLAAPSGNSRKPKVAFDSLGLYHAVWHDDGNGRSQIFYSVYDGVSWSNPEIISGSNFNLRNPAIAIDSSGRAWVAYEDTSWGDTEISVSVRDDVGWNNPTRVTNAKGNKANPAIAMDSFDNVHLVWEDSRNGPSQIFWAQRKKDVEAWLSSGQFGEDTVIMQQKDFNDPYLVGAVQFKNPQLAFDHPRLWIVAEGEKEQGTPAHASVIYRGFRDVDQEFWQSIGVPRFNSDGDFIAEGASFASSPTDRNCVKPTISINSSKGSIVIAWEDQTAPVSQIWGSSYNNFGTEIVAPVQITSRAVDCRNPAAGFVTNQAAIVFESGGDIFLANFDSNFREFQGSATGNADVLIQTSANRQAGNPAIPNFVPAKSVRIVYDFLREKDASLDSIEFPDYYLIGDASISHAEQTYPQDLISTSTLSVDIVSNIDTKEFAFGDMAEGISLRANWKDIKLYFGYDAQPPSIGKFNNSTVLGWGDDRVNDLFVDTFGNLIVAKFDGLIYYNVFTGDITNIELEAGVSHVVTAVKWGGNGAWFVGTTKAIFISKSAGKDWTKFEILNDPNQLITINRIAIDPSGNAVCATNLGILIADHKTTTTEIVSITDGLTPVLGAVDAARANVVRAIAVDENNVIWAGGDLGLIRIENRINFLFFNRKNGMRASYVTDIAIVNKHLRYIGTANGIDKMHGTTFVSITSNTHDLISNNIAQVEWVEDTQSLWVATLHSLYEIVFRDKAHEIIQDEVVQYDSTEILTDSSFDTTTYSILDIEELQQTADDLEITPESSKVLVNKNLIDFGFSVGDLGKSVSFLTPMLDRDEIEVRISSKFIQFHDFNQLAIEKKTIGTQRTSVKKIIKTITENQTLLLTNANKHQVLFLAAEQSLPFTTILLDRDLPKGCLRLQDTLTPTSLKFKIIAFDPLSGINGYMLSNFENFTSDGDTPLDFSTLPPDGVVTHNIGADLNNVTTSLSIPTSSTLPDQSTVVIGDGARLGKWTNITTNTTHLYATTNSPPVVWRIDPEKDTWSAIAKLSTDTNRFVTDMKEFNNVLYIATGSTGAGLGSVFKTTDGVSFIPAAGTAAGINAFNSIAASLDGIVYFGDSAGNIYEHKNDTTTIIFTNIGDEVLSLDIWGNLLVAGTGNKGRVYMINLNTGDDIIIFIGSEQDINSIHIKDAFSVLTAEEAILYAGSSESTTIYRSNLQELSFIKSFSSASKNINRIRSIFNEVLDPSPTGTPAPEGTSAVSAIGDSLFKHNEPAWEFFFRHDDEIRDFLQYGPPGSEGLYIVSDGKITKWTNQLKEKTVFLRLRDKAGNISEAPDLDNPCPVDTDGADKDCCNFAYSLKIADLKNFVNESRIVDITEYGDIVFTFDSPNNRSFYSADEIDEEIGIYTSEVLNGSNDLVSWKTLTWSSVDPIGTSVAVQIRSGVTESETEDAEWTPDLLKNANGEVLIEHITDQYLQFRVILKSQSRGISPTLTSVVLRNLTTQASHFFTTNFILPSRPIKGLLTANTFIPVTADVVFGINTKNSIDFGDYQIIEPNRAFTTTQGQFGEDLRVGVKMLSPGVPQLAATNNPGDPYDASSFVCTISFAYTNSDVSSGNFHFRVQFYNDQFRTQLIHTFFSGNDQTGWSFGAGENNFPSTGVSIGSSSSRTINFKPVDRVETDQRWFITVDVWDGGFFETVQDNNSFICSACNITNETNLTAQYYRTGLSTLSTLPDFSAFTPDFTLLENNLSFFVPNGTTVDWVTTKGQTLPGYVDNFAARFRGKIQAPIAGTYTFELESSDGSQLFINADLIIDNDAAQGLVTKTGSAILAEGFHDIEVQYFEGTGLAGLQLRWITPGETTSVPVPPQRLFHAVANEYCDDTDSPKVFNFAILFELENGETVKINLSP